jgi:hypothetical protein
MGIGKLRTKGWNWWLAIRRDAGIAAKKLSSRPRSRPPRRIDAGPASAPSTQKKSSGGRGRFLAGTDRLLDLSLGIPEIKVRRQEQQIVVYVEEVEA